MPIWALRRDLLCLQYFCADSQGPQLLLRLSQVWDVLVAQCLSISDQLSLQQLRSAVGSSVPWAPGLQVILFCCKGTPTFAGLLMHWRFGLPFKKACDVQIAAIPCNAPHLPLRVEHERGQVMQGTNTASLTGTACAFLVFGSVLCQNNWLLLSHGGHDARTSIKGGEWTVAKGEAMCPWKGVGLTAWSITAFLQWGVHAAEFRLLVTYFGSAGHEQWYRMLQLLRKKMHLMPDRV